MAAGGVKISQRCLLFIILAVSVAVNIVIVCRHFHIKTWFNTKQEVALSVENGHSEASFHAPLEVAPALDTAAVAAVAKPDLQHPRVQPVAAKRTVVLDASEKAVGATTTSSAMQGHSFTGFTGRSMTWQQFADSPLVPVTTTINHSYVERDVFHSTLYHMCPASVVEELKKPQLSSDDVKWCEWAVSKSGGGVVVGKSWGKLTSKLDHTRFDSFNCNAVASTGRNPSCDDSWGDVHIKNWKNSLVDFKCDQGKKSQQRCFTNDNNDVYCEIENMQIDFSKLSKKGRGVGMTASRSFTNDFLSIDCRADNSPSVFPFPHLIKTSNPTNEQCDYVYNGTVLLYSHDDIRNLGHTLNDIFNVWIMLWMSGLASKAESIDMLNIDSFKLGHNFDDQPNAFFLPYSKSLRSILKGIDYSTKTMCVKKALIQPIPPRFFIWESWFTDMKCSYSGPSSLYQRWNFHVRNRLGLLAPLIENHKKSNEGKEVAVPSTILTNDGKLTVLLVVRNEHSNMWGSQRTSRNFLNEEAIKSELSQRGVKSGQFNLVVQDLSKLSFQQQLSLISKSSIMVGAHGAGIASSMHMSVGSTGCCGVIEIYPKGEFSPIKGHGNMARKMGLHYDRMDLSQADSQGGGCTVPAVKLADVVERMVGEIKGKPSCVHPSVLDDPYMDHL